MMAPLASTWCYFGLFVMIQLNIVVVRGQRPNCPGTGANVFEQHCIVPDVIDQAPAGQLEVKYSTTLVLSNGNEVKPEDVKNAPILVSWNAELDQLYALSNVDPDASRASAPINHWLVVNVPGKNVNQGNVLMPYGGACPPNGTGVHRYIFLVYKQSGRLNVADPNLQFQPTNRTKFEIRTFAATHNLGNPIAGNFYQAQYTLTEPAWC